MTTSSNPPQVVLIGIAGPSGCGKSTYAAHLIEHLQSPLSPIAVDHFFIRAVPINHPELGCVLSEEEPETLFTEGLLTLLREIKSDPERITRYHRRDISIHGKRSICVVVEGFLLFALSDEITDLFDIRIFFESTLPQCRLRRYRRQQRINASIPDNQVTISTAFQKWFDYLVWESYLKHHDLQTSRSEKVFQPDGQYVVIDDYIDKRLETLIRR